MAQKKMKDIFTNEMGQILFPGQPTVIQSRKISPGTDITMKNTKPQIALTPYGAAQMSPNQNYSFAGNTVVELPMAQMGAQAGGDDQQAQIMQIIQMYAQLKGVDPNQLIQELQALPQEEQQKSFELMIGEVQTAMAQQQQQQQGMSQQDMQAAQQMQEQQAMGMPMARNGGLTMHQIKGVVDSMVKDAVQRYMSGGEAFPQANRYPEQWAGYTGTQYQGLNKSQVQKAVRDNTNVRLNIDPERGTGDPRWQQQNRGMFNNMLDYFAAKANSAGGPTLEGILGVNRDYQNTYGNMSREELLKEYNDLFMQKNNPNMYPDDYLQGRLNILADLLSQKAEGLSQKAEGGEPCIDCFDKYNPSPQAQRYLPYEKKGETRPNFMFMNGGSKDEFGGQPDLDSIYRMMRSGGLAVNAKKKRGESLSPEEFQEYLSGGSLKEFQGLTQSTTGNTMTGFAPMKFPTSTFMNLNRDEVLIDGKTPDQAVDAFGKRLDTIIDQGKEDMFKYQGLTEDEKRIAQIQERANESQPTGLQSWSTTGDLRNAMSSAGDATQPNTTTTQDKKQGTARYIAYPGLDPATYLTAMTTAMGGKGSLLGLLGNVGSLVADFASPPMAGNRAYGVNPYQSAFDNYRNNITRSSPKQPDSNFSAGEAAAAASRTPIVPPGSTISTSTASPKTSTNQSVTDGNVNDYYNAVNQRILRTQPDNAFKDNQPYGYVPNDQTSQGTPGPTTAVLNALKTGDVKAWNTLFPEENATTEYDEEIAVPQVTTGPREYRKGGKKKLLPKAQFALSGDVTAAGVAGPASSAMNTVGQMRAQQLAAPGALEEFDSENQGPVATPSAGAPLAKGPQMEPITVAPMRTLSSVTPTSPTPEPQVQTSSQDPGPAGLSNRQIRQEDRSNRQEARQDWRDFKKTDEYKDARKQQRKDFWEDPNAYFDHAKAARMVGATQGIADFFRVGNQEYMEDQLKKMGVNTSATLGVSQNKDRGDFMANTGRFRPDDYVEAQDAGRSMTDQTSFYNTFNQMYNAKMGGRILDFLEDGGVYELDEDTIRLIMEAGGSVEYI